MTTFLSRYKLIIFVLFFLAIAAFTVYFFFKMRADDLPMRGVFVREEFAVLEVKGT